MSVTCNPPGIVPFNVADLATVPKIVPTMVPAVAQTVPSPGPMHHPEDDMDIDELIGGDRPVFPNRVSLPGEPTNEYKLWQQQQETESREQEKSELEQRLKVFHGISRFPATPPPEECILGDGWLRKGDLATLISSAGAGKSVAMIQAAIAWGLGLPYFGIRPPRPLRILFYSGEDDGVTIGQCREGLLDHSEAVTGRKLTSSDLQPLDATLRVSFDRLNTGERFFSAMRDLLDSGPADLVMINPLLSYLGGDVVATASEWLRANLLPVLLRRGCAALVAHHTLKLPKDGWDGVDDTYSAIGGAEMANIPRAILTLRPTPAEALSVLTVSKRKTTGWKDGNDNAADRYHVKRTADPLRPAWLPVSGEEAAGLIAAAKPDMSPKGRR
jgi:hypothetical protein